MEINRRASTASLCVGFGQSGLEIFSEFMCMPSLNPSTFHSHLDYIASNASSFTREILEESRRLGLLIENLIYMFE